MPGSAHRTFLAVSDLVLGFGTHGHRCSHSTTAMPKLLRQPGSPAVFDKAYKFRALHVWPIDSTRGFSPTFTPSPWLRGFEVRRVSTPQNYARTHNFQGSLTDILHLWMETRYL